MLTGDQGEEQSEITETYQWPVLILLNVNE